MASKLPSQRLLMVEDEVPALEHYLQLGQQAGYETRGALSLSSAQELLARSGFAVAFIDIHLSRKEWRAEGLQLIEICRRESPSTLIIATSSDPSLEIYNEAMRIGAHGFFKKPLLTTDELKIAIANGQRHRSQLQNLQELRHSGDIHGEPDGIVLSQHFREIVGKIAKSRSLPVVVYGETGTGKEEFAKLIHKRRREKEGEIPFVAVNCANLSNEVSLSMLFGHKKGAFTGAVHNTRGYIGEADGGILFLDEVHAMDKTCQQRLLRVLNDGSYESLGSTQVQYSHFQLVAASTKDLDEATEQGDFLLDLRVRITGLDVMLPPLRERLADLPALIRLFFAREGITIDPGERMKLEKICASYYWQGNIRQLYRVLHSFVVMSSYNSEELRVDQLPIFKTMLPPGHKPLSTPSEIDPGISKEVLARLAWPLQQDTFLDKALDDYEKLIIDHALARHAAVNDVVSALGVSRSALALKRQKYGLQDKVRRSH